MVLRDTYTIEKFIGRGHFGEVYRVRHRFLGVQVVKVVISDDVSAGGFDSLTREACLLAGLTHPNIVRMFEVNAFVHDGKERLFIAMEHIAGETLERLLEREASLCFSAARGLMKDMCAGLAAAHSCSPPVIHRDLKAGNVFVLYDDNNGMHAKIGDFGEACFASAATAMSDSAGALSWRPPEAMFDISVTQSDVFALGILFYRMLAGKEPWEYDTDDADDSDIAQIVMNARMKAPARIDAALGAEYAGVADIIEKLLRPEWRERFGDAKEVLEAIGDLELWSSGVE
jgi:serine/threonine-protein kinase